MQRSQSQAIAVAKPAATDLRFKLGAFVLVLAWLTIIISIGHSIWHYGARRGDPSGQRPVPRDFVPLRLYLLFALSLFVVAFQIAVSFNFDISPMNMSPILPAVFLAGFLPTWLILAVQVASGFMRPNEDLELIRQRRERGVHLDGEIGLGGVKKPSWWRRVRDNPPPAAEMGANRGGAAGASRAPAGGRRGQGVTSVNAAAGSGRPINAASSTEPPPPPSYKEATRGTASGAAGTGLGSPTLGAGALGGGTQSGATGLNVTRIGSDGSLARGSSTGTDRSASVTGAPPQQIRSMLDV